MDTLLLTHAMLTSITAIASSLSSAAQKAIDIIVTSESIEHRAKYNITNDYTKLPNVKVHCLSIRKEINRYSERMMQFIHEASTELYTDKFEDHFCNRIDVCDEVYRPQFEYLRCAIRDSFNPYKPSDPISLYAIMYALFISDVFESMSIYARYYSDGFNSGKFNILTRYHLTKSLRTLVHRCQFHDRLGNSFKFIMTVEESIEYNKLKSKKSWQIKYGANPPIAIEVWRVFNNEKCLRASYELSKAMLSIKTLDQIEKLSDGIDTEYRKNVSYKYIKSGITFFEQSMLNSYIQCNKWDEVVKQVPKYIALYNRRQTMPVVCFQAYFVKDSKGNIICSPEGRKRIKTSFIAIFNSAYEAQNERGVKVSTIRKSVNCNGRYIDDKCNIWVSFQQYCNILYATLLNKGLSELAHKLYDSTKDHITYATNN